MSTPSELSEPPVAQGPPPLAAWVKFAATAVSVIAALALLASLLIWQRLSTIQEQLARQTADAGAQSVEARTIAREAVELARETAAKLTVAESRLNEVALQRSQLEALMQSLSRTRDENLVVDIESAVRLAQQQAQLTGSVEPLLAALKTADQRVLRAAQPRLSALQRAMARDMARIKATALSDTPALLVKMDDLVRLADELVLANAVGKLAANTAANDGLAAAGKANATTWWQGSLQTLLDEARGLLRVSRIEQAESALLSPEQSFFVRENFKLKLLNARLGLLARQLDSSRADLKAASTSLGKYFDQNSRKTTSAQALLAQVQAEMRTLEVPRLDDTLAALATAAAGR
jgi:uroporphyrin-III C-methyltransferase